MNSSTLVDPSMHAADPNPFDRLRTVDLAEVNSMAALQTRVDRKYLIAGSDLGGLFGGLGAMARLLEIEGRRHSSYMSTYFDTPALDSYFGAARSRPFRFKVRVRSYRDSDTHYLEVKTRSRSRQTTKTRCFAAAEDHDGLNTSGRQFVVDTLSSKLQTRPGFDHTAMVAALQPTLSTHYQRTTLLIDPDGSEPSTTSELSRATIDTSLAFTTPGQASRSFPSLAIIETKTAGPPSSIDRLLWRSGHRPVKVSKFGIGLALFHPSLPATKWNRVLRQHFAWQSV